MTIRIDEHTTFHMLELTDDTMPTGHFRLERTSGTLAVATALFVVEDDTGRVVPMSAVRALYANGTPTAPNGKLGRNRADRLAR